MRQAKGLLAWFLVATLVCLARARAAPAADLNLVPWPRAVETGSGSMELTAKSRIVATQACLEPLAKLLAEEILQTTGRHVAAAMAAGEDQDILLKLDPSLEGEAYSLEVNGTAVVAGGNYNAVAMGTVTLLQALHAQDGALSLPRLKIADRPDYKMRAIQMCIKHQPHQMSKIKQGVDLCRQFKLNTLALHCSNYQILWLLCPPFRENPVGKGDWDGGQTYSPEEWKDLVEYARLRGVAILPEWGPADFVSYMNAWFRKARQFVPEKDFDPAKKTLLDSPKFWANIDEMTGQLADIFYTSEYIHVGALSGETGALDTPPDRPLMQREGLRHSADVWAWVLKRLYDEINKKHGKETMAFEGIEAEPAAHVKLPKDVAFFAYQTWYYPADQMIADGYRVLNAAWRPLYTCGGFPAREIYNWNPRILWHNIDPNINVRLPKSDRLLGSLLSTWEGGEIGHMELLTDPGAAMAERCWNENAGKGWADFTRRLPPARAKLEAIQYPMGVALGGLLEDKALPPGWPVAGKAPFGDTLTIAMNPNVPGVKVYYTVQGGHPKPGDGASKLYETPLT
ncbi:MAG: family 20 glycosylhydrolase, partial [Planctomycetota bacterium]|nr:family 20 glycosylhydrolase [Planctomycetota bacterium]